MNFIREFLNKRLKRREPQPVDNSQVSPEPVNVECLDTLDDLDDPVLEQVVDEFCDLCKKINCDCLIFIYRTDPEQSQDVVDKCS